MKLWQAPLIAAALLLPFTGTAHAKDKNKGGDSSSGGARQVQRASGRQTQSASRGRQTSVFGGFGSGGGGGGGGSRSSRSTRGGGRSSSSSYRYAPTRTTRTTRSYNTSGRSSSSSSRRTTRHSSGSGRDFEAAGSR